MIDTICIGKVVSFYNGYIHVRYNYSNFLRYAKDFEIGNFLIVSSNKENNYIVAQIVDIYDVFNEREENIRISIANNGDITITERDIYLFVEMKLKPLIRFNEKEIDWNVGIFTSRLKDVFVFDGQIKNAFLKLFFNKIIKNFDKNIKSIDKVGIKNLLKFDNFVIKGIVLVVGIDIYNIFNKNHDGKVKVFYLDEFKESKSSFSENELIFLIIKNRNELMEISNDYIIPSLVIGKNLLKADYEILSKIIMLRNDYFFTEFYLIQNGFILPLSYEK